VHKRADKRKVRLPFNFIIGIVVSIANLVLLIMWQDKNLVRFLTIAYLYGDEDISEVNWRQL